MTIGRKIRSINNTDNYTDSLFSLKTKISLNMEINISMRLCGPEKKKFFH